MAAAGADGGRAGWGVYPRAKPAPRRHGCRRPRPAAWWQALDAQRRRLPHWGREKRRRARPARKEPATRRPVRWPTRCRCGKRAAATVPVRMRAAATKRKRLAPPGKACHACAGSYLRATPCGRPVPDPVWRAHARADRVSPWPCRVAAVDAQRRGCHRWVSPRKRGSRRMAGRARRFEPPRQAHGCRAYPAAATGPAPTAEARRVTAAMRMRSPLPPKKTAL